MPDRTPPRAQRADVVVVQRVPQPLPVHAPPHRPQRPRPRGPQRRHRLDPRPPQPRPDPAAHTGEVFKVDLQQTARQRIEHREPVRLVHRRGHLRKPAVRRHPHRARHLRPDRLAKPRLDATPHVLRPVPRPENAAELVHRAHRIDRDLGVHRVRDPALHPHVEVRALAHQGNPRAAPPRLVHPGSGPDPVTLRRRVRRDHTGPRLRVREHRHRASVQRRRRLLLHRGEVPIEVQVQALASVLGPCRHDRSPHPASGRTTSGPSFRALLAKALTRRTSNGPACGACTRSAGVSAASPAVRRDQPRRRRNAARNADFGADSGVRRFDLFFEQEGRRAVCSRHWKFQ